MKRNNYNRFLSMALTFILSGFSVTGCVWNGSGQEPPVSESEIAMYRQEILDQKLMDNSIANIGNWYYFQKAAKMGANPERLFEDRKLSLAGRVMNDGPYVMGMNEETLWYLVENDLLDINEAKGDMNNFLTEQMDCLPMAEWYLEHGASPNAVREWDGFSVLEQVITDPKWTEESRYQSVPLLSEPVSLLLQYGAVVTDRTVELAVWVFFNTENNEVPPGGKEKYQESYGYGCLDFAAFRTLWEAYKKTGGTKKLPEVILAAVEDDTDTLLAIQKKTSGDLSDKILSCVTGVGSADTICALAKGGADFCKSDILKAAIRGGNLENVKTLYELGDETWTDEWDNIWMTAFDYGLRYGSAEIVRYLYEHSGESVPIANFNLEYQEKREDGKTYILPFIQAGGRKKWVEWHNEDALYIAGERRSQELVDFILNETEYPDDPERLRFAYSGRTDRGAAVDGGDFLAFLLERGLDPKSSPANVAVEGESEATRMIAVQALCDGNWQDYHLFTQYGFDIRPYLDECLHSILRASNEDRIDILIWLLERGADPNSEDWEEYTDFEAGKKRVKCYKPLQQAIVSGRPDYVRILREHGARYEQENSRAYACVDLYYVTQKSAVFKDTELLELILEMGADPNIGLAWNPDLSEKPEEDPYYYHLFTWMMKQYFELVQSQEGMDGAMNRILQKWMLGQEPFSDERIVCYQEYMKEVFDLLTRYGGDPNRKDGGGRTVRTMAEEAGREEILEYLALNET